MGFSQPFFYSTGYCTFASQLHHFFPFIYCYLHFIFLCGCNVPVHVLCTLFIMLYISNKRTLLGKQRMIHMLTLLLEVTEENNKYSCYTYIEYWPITVGTSWCKLFMIVPLTKGPSISLEEVGGSQWYLTSNTSEMLWMPCAAQCSTNLANDWFSACCTFPLLCGTDALSGHIRLQGTQHRVQLANLSNT